jgi:uncharacterized membrane protein YesL
MAQYGSNLEMKETLTQPIATGELRQRILLGAVLGGIFFGLMPPYVLTIVVVATWGMPPLEGPGEQAFRAVYLLRLVLGNLVGLGAGALLTAGAVNLGLKVARKATYGRAVLGGALLGVAVGALTAGSTPLMLLISSSNVEWAHKMLFRALACGAMMGLVNGIAAGVVIVYFIRRARTRSAL